MRKWKFILVAFWWLIPIRGFSRGKLDVSMGYYSLSAKANDKKTNVQNLGVYQLNYRKDITRKLEISIGYSLIATQIYTGDFGFGPDIGMTYFPFTSANTIEATNNHIELTSFELYKPYLITAFHQRQYQSIQSNYAGFSFGIGNEFYWKNFYYINTQLRYLPLGGPDKATSDEIDLIFGITLSY